MTDSRDPVAAAIYELIETFGYTEARIAEGIRELAGLTTSQSSINRMKGGKQTPRFDEGMAILRLLEQAKAAGTCSESQLAKAV